MGDFADMYDYLLWGDEHQQEVTCKHCGKKGLYWDDSSGRWTLVDDEGDRHVCDQRRVRARVIAEFEALD